MCLYWGGVLRGTWGYFSSRCSAILSESWIQVSPSRSTGIKPLGFFSMNLCQPVSQSVIIRGPREKKQPNSCHHILLHQALLRWHHNVSQIDHKHQRCRQLHNFLMDHREEDKGDFLRSSSLWEKRLVPFRFVLTLLDISSFVWQLLLCKLQRQKPWWRSELENIQGTE